MFEACQTGRIYLEHVRLVGLVLEAVASTAQTSPLFCNGNSVCGVLLTWLNSQYVYFLVLFT